MGSEHQPLGVNSPAVCLAPQVGFGRRRRADKPEYALWHCREESHPYRKDVRSDFVTIIEATEYKCVTRKATLVATIGMRGNLARLSVGLIGNRHMHDFLIVEFLLRHRERYLIGDDIVDEV